MWRNNNRLHVLHVPNTWTIDSVLINIQYTLCYKTFPYIYIYFGKCPLPGFRSLITGKQEIANQSYFLHRKKGKLCISACNPALHCEPKQRMWMSQFVFFRLHSPGVLLFFWCVSSGRNPRRAVALRCFGNGAVWGVHLCCLCKSQFWLINRFKKILLCTRVEICL